MFTNLSALFKKDSDIRLIAVAHNCHQLTACLKKVVECYDFLKLDLYATS